MKQLTCEMCGGTDLMKQDGMFVCQSCGTKYSVEEAKKMMMDESGDVPVSTLKVDTAGVVQKHLANARRAKQKEDWSETEKYYNLVEQDDPTNIEAIFYSTYARVKSALLEAETSDKRQGVFNILVKGVSIIGDNYDDTNEEHPKLLFKIMDDIKGLKKGKIVPTTHLQEYVTKNGYGNIVDRNQVVENDSLEVTYEMIDKVFYAYMDSIANIIVKFSPEAIKKLFMDNMKSLCLSSPAWEKVAGHIDGYRTPDDSCAEIAKQVKVSEETSLENITTQINDLAKTICPFYMTDGALWAHLRYEVNIKLRKLHPDVKALKEKGVSSALGCFLGILFVAVCCVVGFFIGINL